MYTTPIYTFKCRQAKILPLEYMFTMNDLVLFHAIVYNRSPLSMPDYLSLYDGTSGQCNTHLDQFSFVSNIQHSITGIKNLKKSFFF